MRDEGCRSELDLHTLPSDFCRLRTTWGFRAQLGGLTRFSQKKIEFLANERETVRNGNGVWSQLMFRALGCMQVEQMDL